LMERVHKKNLPCNQPTAEHKPLALASPSSTPRYRRCGGPSFTRGHQDVDCCWSGLAKSAAFINTTACVKSPPARRNTRSECYITHKLSRYSTSSAGTLSSPMSHGSARADRGVDKQAGTRDESQRSDHFTPSSTYNQTHMEPS